MQVRPGIGSTMLVNVRLRRFLSLCYCVKGGTHVCRHIVSERASEYTWAVCVCLQFLGDQAGKQCLKPANDSNYCKADEDRALLLKKTCSHTQNCIFTVCFGREGDGNVHEAIGHWVEAMI